MKKVSCVILLLSIFLSTSIISRNSEAYYEGSGNNLIQGEETGAIKGNWYVSKNCSLSQNSKIKIAGEKGLEATCEPMKLDIRHKISDIVPGATYMFSLNISTPEKDRIPVDAILGVFSADEKYANKDIQHLHYIRSHAVNNWTQIMGRFRASKEADFINLILMNPLNSQTPENIGEKFKVHLDDIKVEMLYPINGNFEPFIFKSQDQGDELFGWATFGDGIVEPNSEELIYGKGSLHLDGKTSKSPFGMIQTEELKCKKGEEYNISAWIKTDTLSGLSIEAGNIERDNIISIDPSIEGMWHKASGIFTCDAEERLGVKIVADKEFSGDAYIDVVEVYPANLTGESKDNRYSHLNADIDLPNLGKLIYSDDKISIATAPNTLKVLREDILPEEKQSSIRVEMARNEFEPFQIIVKSSKDRVLQNIDVDFPDVQGVEIDSIHLVDYIKVSQPSDTGGRFGFLPDALVPLSKYGKKWFEHNQYFKSNLNQPIWITIKSNKETPAGLFNGKIKVTFTDHTNYEIPIQLTIWDFMLPDTLTTRSAYFYMLSYPQYSFHQAKTDNRKELIMKYFEDAEKHHISPFLYNPHAGPLGGVKYKIDLKNPEKIRVDFSEYSKNAEEVFNKFNFNTFTYFPRGFTGIHKVNDPSKDICYYVDKAHGFEIFNEPIQKETKICYGSKAFEELTKAIWSKTAQFMERRGWLDKMMFYIADEPKASDFEYIRAYAKLVHEADPRIKIASTIAPNIEELVGAIDIWIPGTSSIEAIPATISKVQTNNNVWWYVCNKPHAPFANFFLDHSGIEPRILFWTQTNFDLKGALYYSVDGWRKNELLENRWLHPFVEGANGDGFFYYPPTKEDLTKTLYKDSELTEVFDPTIIPSIRLELIREGLEDAEYIYILKDRLAEKPELKDLYLEALSLAKEIAGTYTSYSRSPSKLMDTRRKIALAITGQTSSQFEEHVEVSGEEKISKEEVLTAKTPSKEPEAQTSESVSSQSKVGCSLPNRANKSNNAPIFIILLTLIALYIQKKKPASPSK